MLPCSLISIGILFSTILHIPDRGKAKIPMDLINSNIQDKIEKKDGRVNQILILLFLWNCTSPKLEPPKFQDKFQLQIQGSDFVKTERGLLAEHYPASNERRIDLFWEPIDSLGGVYLGVGTDQNFSLAARARSEYIILMDFDPGIVAVNKLHIEFLKASNSYEAFKNFWDRKNKEKSLDFLRNLNRENFSDLKKALELGQKPGIGVPERLKELDFMHKKFGLETFSHKDSDFQYLRKMAEESKIIALHGDLTGVNVLQEIASVLQKNNLTINLVYTSNAEEYFKFPPNFRKNILSLPISEKGIIVRTLTAGAKSFGFPDGEKFPDDYPFHYNYQKLSNLKKWMEFPKEFNILYMMSYRTNLKKGFSVLEKEPPKI